MANIVETLEQYDEFQALIECIKKSGADEILKGPATYTLFAPTDAAFAKLPPGVLRGLMNDPPRLKNIILHHVAQGIHTMEELSEKESIQTLQGDSIGINLTEGMQVNQASIDDADIEAGNGIIHIIDTVLLPKDEAAALGPSAPYKSYEH